MSHAQSSDINIDRQQSSLIKFLTLYFSALPLVFAVYVVSAYRGRFFIEDISYVIIDGYPQLNLVGTHSFGDFQQLLLHTKTNFSYANHPYIDSPFTYLLSKLLNLLSGHIPLSILYLALVLSLCLVLGVIALRFVRSPMLAVLCTCSILLSIGSISAFDRGNFWIFCFPLLICSSIFSWDKPKGLLLLTIASCIKPPLLLLVFVVLLRTRRSVHFYLVFGTLCFLNVLSIMVISSTVSLRHVLNEIRYYLNNLYEFDFNRIDQGITLANSTLYTTNSIATIKELFARSSFASEVELIISSGFYIVLVLIILNVLYLSYKPVCPVDLPIFGVCTLACCYLLSAAYALLIFTPFIFSLYKEKFRATIGTDKKPLITWPFLVFFATVPLSGALIYSGPEYFAFFFPYLVMFKLFYVSISVWRNKTF